MLPQCELDRARHRQRQLAGHCDFGLGHVLDTRQPRWPIVVRRLIRRGLRARNARCEHSDDRECGSHVSYLKAVIGSSRDARIAGYSPNTTPTPAATTNATAAVVAGKNILNWK